MDWFDEQIETARRTGTSSLNLTGIGLARLPGSLQSLTALARLDLGRNQLSALPEWLGSLTALTRLDLWGNQLTALPESLGNLTALTRLSLSANRLIQLPARLGNLTALTWLDLVGNRLSALPESLGNLTALTRLSLGRNQLSALPESLGNLTALTRIDLAGNQLSALPESLGNLKALTRIDLAGNQLSALPESLVGLLAGEHVASAPLQAWIDGTRTTVASPAALDAILEHVPPGGVGLSSVDSTCSLFISLSGNHSALMWEGDGDVMLSWGPPPPGAPPGLTVADLQDALSDPWFTADDTEPMAITEEQARRAGHEFLRTGRRPANVQWIDKP